MDCVTVKSLLKPSDPLNIIFHSTYDNVDKLLTSIKFDLHNSAEFALH